jgi:hypothetical protein
MEIALNENILKTNYNFCIKNPDCEVTEQNVLYKSALNQLSFKYIKQIGVVLECDVKKLLKNCEIPNMQLIRSLSSMQEDYELGNLTEDALRAFENVHARYAELFASFAANISKMHLDMMLLRGIYVQTMLLKTDLTLNERVNKRALAMRRYAMIEKEAVALSEYFKSRILEPMNNKISFIYSTLK